MLRKCLTVAKMPHRTDQEQIVNKTRTKKILKNILNMGYVWGMGGTVYIYSNLKKIFLIFKLWGLTSV